MRRAFNGRTDRRVINAVTFDLSLVLVSALPIWLLIGSCGIIASLAKQRGGKGRRDPTSPGKTQQRLVMMSPPIQSHLGLHTESLPNRSDIFVHKRRSCT